MLSIFVVFCVATVLELVRKSLYRVAVDRLWTKLFDRVWPKNLVTDIGTPLLFFSRKQSSFAQNSKSGQ